MTHFTTPEFWQYFESLLEDVRRLPDKNFTLLKENPRHASLHLKKVGKFWIVRVGLHYWAVAKEHAEGLNCFGIGHHSEYDRLLS